MYINHKLLRATADIVLPNYYPPSSPPTSFRRIIRIVKQTKAQQINTNTLKPSGAEGTKYFPSAG